MEVNKNTIGYANKKKYISSYNKETYCKISLWFRKDSEADIIEVLNQQKSKAEFIKKLVIKEVRK